MVSSIYPLKAILGMMRQIHILNFIFLNYNASLPQVLLFYHSLNYTFFIKLIMDYLHVENTLITFSQM